MSYMPLGESLKNSESIYKVTLIAAKRAIELNNGAPKLVETNSKKPSTIALEEIVQGKVSYQMIDHKEKKKK